MKNNLPKFHPRMCFATLGSLIVLCAVLLAGCQKQPQDLPGVVDPSSSLSAEKLYEFANGVVRFRTFEDYHAFLASEEQKESFLADIERDRSYTSYAESHMLMDLSTREDDLDLDTDSIGPDSVDTDEDDLEDLVNSPMLSGLINSDGIVQIGNYYFKLDYVNALVYVAHVSSTDASYAKLLNNDASGTDVFVFSTDDDILDILEVNNYPVNEAYEGQSSSLFDRCGSGAPERKAKGSRTGRHYGCKPTPDPRDKGWMDLKVVYQKAGFYFSLHSKAQIYCSCYGDNHIYRQHGASNGQTAYIRYTPKCRDEVITSENIEIIGWNLSRRPYEGGRGLKKFHYRVVFRYKGETSFYGIPLGTYYTPQPFEVRYGY